ncbi:MAG: ATP-dependent helicase [Jatrophihabitans sp.]
MSEPVFRLVAPAGAAATVPILDEAQRRVVDHRSGPLRVLAGPGTGKTTTIVEAVVERIGRGVPVDSVMVLTFGRHASAELRDRIAARLGRVIREPVARTLHSYAFGVLRMAANVNHEPAPRLLSGSEQDIMLRDLLAGDLQRRGTQWPSSIAPALGTRGFAQELRELYLRAAERGIAPDELAQLGATHGRPDWRAAAQFWQQYLDVSSLQKPGSFDAAELIQAAIDVFESEPRLLELERSHRRYLFVDEYQDVDPAQVRLLALLARGAEEVVVVGDPDQSIYAFRGADPAAMGDAAEVFGAAGEIETVPLGTCRRSGSTLLAATRNVAHRLGGRLAQHRELVPAEGLDPGAVEVALLRTASEEAGFLATVLRREHLENAVPWSRMAVLVRSTTLHQATLRRALLTAGVPVASATSDLPLIEQSAVAALLLALRAVAHPDALTGPVAEELLLGPIGGADAIALRRLRRELGWLTEVEPQADPLAILLSDPVQAATVLEHPPAAVRRLTAALAAGRAALAAGENAEEVLWAIWDGTGLARRWEQVSFTGGAAGAAADRDLDSVIELFAAAARLADALPLASVDALIEQVAAQQIPLDSSAVQTGRGSDEAVSILTAHASKGLEWDVVCVAGVQEGTWPDLRLRGSLLGSELLVDVVAGRAEVAGLSTEPLLREERRLFYVAVTRARRRLVVTAVHGDEQAPSRFLDELDPLPAELDRRPLTTPLRALHMPGVVAALRSVVTDPAEAELDRSTAAGYLSRLAAAGVPGAFPDDWWGLAALSDDRGLVDPGEAVYVSPSQLDAYDRCALKTFLERVGVSDQDTTAASMGTLVHKVAQDARPDASVDELAALLDAGWSELAITPRWFDGKERTRAHRMLTRLAEWLAASRSELALLAIEQKFDAQVGSDESGDVHLGGTVDRLERDSEGRLVVVDLKTGKGKPSAVDLQKHPQLGAYQMAVQRGAFAELAESAESGGALLVQLGSTGPVQQEQQPLGSDADPQWIGDTIDKVAGLMRGSQFPATVNSYCGYCSARRLCPAQEGAQVTTPAADRSEQIDPSAQAGPDT